MRARAAVRIDPASVGVLDVIEVMSHMLVPRTPARHRPASAMNAMIAPRHVPCVSPVRRNQRRRDDHRYQGAIVSTATSSGDVSWREQLGAELDDFAHGAAGGFLFGVPLLYTMELWFTG